jgi:CubicO group peptidase (beta-lactamase class C family)
MRMICLTAATLCVALSILPMTVQGRGGSSDRGGALTGRADPSARRAEQAQRLDRFIEERMLALNVPGASLAVIDDGKIVYHRTLGWADPQANRPVSKRTVFEAASLSKPLFAYFAMSFVEEGKLDLDRPLWEYLEDKDLAHDPRARKITARMVLSHTSGLPNWRSETPQKTLSLSFEPGTGYAYSGEGYQYLARVLAKIAGTDDAGLEAIFQQRVARPLGMRRAYFVRDPKRRVEKARPHKDGRPMSETAPIAEFGAAYSLETEAVDYARWVIALLDGKGLSAQSYASYFAPQQVRLPDNEPMRAFGLSDWALGFSMYETPAGRLYAHGGNNEGFTSLVVLSRERRWGLVLFTNADQVTALSIELMTFLQKAEY